MYEEHRKYKHCIFCGQTDLTKEHIFGKSLAKRLAVKVPWIASPQSELHGFNVKGSCPITDLAPKILCRKCNNERLSPIMKESLPVLLDTITGNTTEITGNQCRLLISYFERFAAIFDVITSTYEISDKHRDSKEFRLSARFRVAPPVISQRERRAWLEGKPMPIVTIYIGNHEGILGITPHTIMAHEKAPSLSQDSTQQLGKRIAVVIGKLAVCMDINLPGRRPFPGFQKLDGAGLSWPPGVAVSYDSYLALLGQTPDIVHLRKILSMSEARAHFEQYVRNYTQK